LPTSRNSRIADNGSNISSSIDKGQQQPKKTLAATLVEDSMKQSVVLVPAYIAKLAQRFCSHFNSEMLPHKPPVSAVANRVLFTDAEDRSVRKKNLHFCFLTLVLTLHVYFCFSIRLLAMGLMDYNTDWEAIQKHYLPCKSKHQVIIIYFSNVFRN
jgi:hypothetical protein